MQKSRKTFYVLVALFLGAFQHLNATPFDLITATHLTVNSNTQSGNFSYYPGWLVATSEPLYLPTANGLSGIAENTVITSTGGDANFSVNTNFLSYAGAQPLEVGHAAGGIGGGISSTAFDPFFANGPIIDPFTQFGAQWGGSLSNQNGFVGSKVFLITVQIGQDAAQFHLLVDYVSGDVDGALLQIDEANRISSVASPFSEFPDYVHNGHVPDGGATFNLIGLAALAIGIGRFRANRRVCVVK